jgi:hypothetical protein
MNWSRRIRQTHRWISMVFTATVVMNFVVLALMEPPLWVQLTPLPFLFALLFTGLYLFVLPYLGSEAPGRATERAGRG